MKLARLDEDTFNRIVLHTGLQPNTVEMTRQVLVHGRSQAEVADEYKVSRQRMNAALNVVDGAHRRHGSAEQVLLETAVRVPPALALALSRLSQGFEREFRQPALWDLAARLACEIEAARIEEPGAAEADTRALSGVQLSLVR